MRTNKISNHDKSPLPVFVPGEVLALLTPMQELEAGLYLVHSVNDGWASLRWLIDDQDAEQLLVTDRQAVLPVRLLNLFMPVGVRLSFPA